jgi:glycosyltransferase involved in cell wall biosynthesis
MREESFSRAVSRADTGDLQETAMPRVFLECTYTWAYAGNTGIQRVVRNIVNYAGAIAPSMGMVCRPAVRAANGWRIIPQLSLERAPANNPEMLGATLLRRARGLALNLPRPIGRVLLHHRVKRSLRLAVWRIGDVLTMWRDRSSRHALKFQEADILLLLDSSWHFPIWRGVIRAKQQGARIGVVLYDLIPLLMPDLCVPEHVAAFKAWLDQVVRHADFFLCISRTVAEEAREQLGLHYPEIRTRRPTFGSFRLGAELDLAKAVDSPRPALRAVFEQPERYRTYITVGTIEPRKNHNYLLDAFDSAWARGNKAKLCIIGKEGWKCGAVLQRIRAHQQLDKNLFLFHDINDGELQYCYQRAHALIIPSIAEGFGLPVVEALSLGCRVWASDLPVFQEVGGDFCLYFDLRSAEALTDLLVKEGGGSSNETVRPLAEFRWPDWQESCVELLRKIDELGAD